MPRKTADDDWKTDERGRYRRMVGWKEVGGKRIQQPFYFGTDLDQAKARYLRVRELCHRNSRPKDTGTDANVFAQTAVLGSPEPCLPKSRSSFKWSSYTAWLRPW
jgi:hypothetical protein